MSGPAVVAAAAAIALSTILPASASSSRVWVLRNHSDFSEAKLDGLSLSPDGALRLSARVTTVLDPAQPNLWCLGVDRMGRIYAGSGNDGRVFRIGQPGDEPEVVFDSEQLEVQAIAFDSKDRLFAATSPRGGVYMVTPEGMGVLVFRPEATYIWAIAFDERDRLYVATGQRGRVYRVDKPGPNAQATTVLDGREDHIRSLARAADGSFYAGSDQNGILYRIAPDGEVSVVYDSPMREIAAILPVSRPGQDDLVYFAALEPAPGQRGSSTPRSGAGVTRIRVTADDSQVEPDLGPGEEGEEGDRASPQRGQQRPAAAPAYHGAVYAVTRSGYARKIWESRESVPLSLAVYDPAGRILVGTGDAGRVLLLDHTGEATDFVVVPSQQINALLPVGSGDYLAAASNLGQVALISPGSATEGTVTSTALDAGFTSSWGSISWTSETPRGASVSIRVRTGNTEKPDDSWSDWSRDYTDASGTPVDRPRARYLQWQAILRGGGSSSGPVLKSINIPYLQDNLPPEVGSIEVLPAGVVLAGTGGSGNASESAAARRAQNQPRRGFERGRRAVQWKTEDANDDEMRFDVFFKAEDETLWKPLSQEISDEFLTWDSTSMPDGVYRVKVVATDAPSNPTGSATTGSRISMAFDVDNTPPVVGPIRITLKGRVAEASVTIDDSFSSIGDAEYSIDASDWIRVLPEDRIADSRSETYRFRTKPLDPGEHTVTVRARDRAGNTAAGKVVIRVER